MRAHAKFRTAFPYALREETSVLYLVSKCQLTLTPERRVGWCPELFTRGFARKFSRRVARRNLTEIGLEIPGEGRVNFRHLVVSSARHQKSYLQQKSNRLERTTEETRCIIKNRHAIWIAFVTQMWNSFSSSPQSNLRDCKSCLSEREHQSLWPLGSIQMISGSFRRNFYSFKYIAVLKANKRNISKMHAFIIILQYISMYHTLLYLFTEPCILSSLFFYDVDLQLSEVVCAWGVPSIFGFPFFAIFISRLSSIPFTRSHLLILLHFMTFWISQSVTDVIVANSKYSDTP